MEEYIEYLVKRRTDTKTTLIKTGIIVGTVVLGIGLLLGCLLVPLLRMLYPLILAGVIYGAWFLISSMKLEYEYILTNYELDVDKIIAQRRRKRMITVNLRNIDLMAPKTDRYKQEYESANIKTFIHAQTGEPGTEYFVRFSTQKTGQTVLFFNPNERIISGARHASPRKVLEA